MGVILYFIIISLCIVTLSSSLSSTPFIRALNGKEAPFLAILTETDACDSSQHMKKTIDMLEKVLGECNSQNIDLIVIRVSVTTSTQKPEDFQQRVVSITQRIMQLKSKIYSQDKFHKFLVIVNDNLEAALDGHADGVHVKGKNADSIPYIRGINKNRMKHDSGTSHDFVIGTSTHDLQSAINISRIYEPDYLFIGTCYLTSSHPEKKSLHDLEGPMLPGKVKAALVRNHKEFAFSDEKIPIIFAIGGINEMNCHEPFNNGADGVAVIKAVSRAANPDSIVSYMKDKMIKSVK